MYYYVISISFTGLVIRWYNFIRIEFVSVAPIIAKASSVCNHGYSQSGMYWYNEYYNSSSRHLAQTKLNGYYFTSGTASAGYWAAVYVDYFGPYQPYYYAYDV